MPILNGHKLEICLWRTLDSTLDILFIFTPKLKWHETSRTQTFHEHLITVVNASTLLSSVTKVILSKFKTEETTVLETLVAANRLTDTIQRMKFLVKHQPSEKINFKVKFTNGI